MYNIISFVFQLIGTGAGKWKFTVTAAGSSTADSFFTGFVILNHILSTPAYCK